jgi:hypothetical protein
LGTFFLRISFDEFLLIATTFTQSLLKPPPLRLFFHFKNFREINENRIAQLVQQSDGYYRLSIYWYQVMTKTLALHRSRVDRCSPLPYSFLEVEKHKVGLIANILAG